MNRTAGHDQVTAEAVGHCVRQARDYFGSAAAASLLTRPVLLYYGMVSLGKLLLLLDPAHPLGIDEVEQLERRGHGLGQIDPEASQEALYRVEDGMVAVTADERKGRTRIGRGVFPQLAARLCPRRGEAWLGERLRIRDVLRAVPQLDLLMRQSFGDPNGFSGLWVSQIIRGQEHLLEIPQSESGRATREEAQQRIAYLDPTRYAVVETGELDPLFRIAVSDEDLYALPSREEFTGRGYVLPPSLLGERMEGLLAQYVVMYALSIVARYKPHRWARILQGETTLLPILEQLMAVAERWWPNLVLNKLAGTTVLFAPTMLLGLILAWRSDAGQSRWSSVYRPSSTSAAPPSFTRETEAE